MVTHRKPEAGAEQRPAMRAAALAFLTAELV
jgi:hypothetical protein